MAGRHKVTSIAGAALAAFLAGFWLRGHVPAIAPIAAAAGRKVLYWHDPMHPEYKSDKPGIAPDCGMQLEPVYADGEKPRAKASAPAGTVRISSDRQQVIGLRFGAIENSASRETLRLAGRVAADDTAIYRIFATTDGWIREIPPHEPGSLVEKDELLTIYYARELLTPQQAYLYALATRDRAAADTAADQMQLIATQIRTAEDGLVTLGMSGLQIRELARSRTANSLMEVRAPGSGVLTGRNVSRGLRIDRGAELFRIADIRKVVVLADVFEKEAGLIAPGGPAKIRYRDRVIAAQIAGALPLFDSTARTLKLRLEADNPRLLLRPDMFVDVEVPVQLSPGISVPAEAVVDSGTRKLVYVASDDETFEPRIVETGWHFGDRVSITRGLQAGEKIVISGTFLLDSESRLNLANAAPAAHGGASRDPACGLEIDAAKALKLEYGGHTYVFCSEACRRKFKPAPATE